MSQNNDQSRPNSSQPWYDNGQVPQSKKFPFGAGSENGNGDPETENRMNSQNDQNAHMQQGTTPPYGQQPANGGPQAPQYGAPQQNNGQQYGNGHHLGNGQNYGASQPASQPYVDNDQGQYQPPQYQAPEQDQNRFQAQGYGSNGAGQYNDQGQSGDRNQYGDQGQYNNGQGQYDGGQQPNQPNNQQYGSQPQGEQGPLTTDSGSQQFQGILDPHTGEIHPVPDLDGLQDADALLVVVSGPDSGSQILLDTDVVTVGRSPNADIFLDDVTVSRKHAEFIRTPSGFTLRDTGSLNGTYVGRQLIDSIELQNGADVQIGKFRMIFQQRPRS